MDLIGAPDWVPRPSRIGPDTELVEMQKTADAAIAARLARGPEGVPDLLDLLMAGEDPKTKRSMTTEELRDNLLAFIVAGHETTALSLAWALYLVAFDQEVQDRARAEVAEVLTDGRPAQSVDVERLPFIRQIIDEALRLYPPAAMVSRTAQEEDELCGTKILPGDTVILPIYAAQAPCALGRARRLSARPLLRSQSHSAICLSAVRGRPPHLHRGEFRITRGGDHPGHIARAVSIHAGQRPRPGSSDDPYAAPRRGRVVDGGTGVRGIWGWKQAAALS